MPVYLDNAASTPLDPVIFEFMRPWMLGHGANAASVQHAPGRAVATAVSTARAEVAALLHAQPEDLVFTGSATEACNLAIKGLIRPLLRSGQPVHCVAPMHEHPAVLGPLRRMEREGAEVTLVRPSAGGVICAADLEPHLRPDTVLVACMHANNELGTLNDIMSVGALCQARGVQLLVDASCSAGHVPLPAGAADLLVASSHKMHGPAGVGVLAIRSGAHGCGLEPLIEGGGHESALRSGSLDAPAIIGFGAACTRALQVMPQECGRQQALRDRLESTLLKLFPGSVVHGAVDSRVPAITMCTLATGLPEPIPTLVTGVACSTGAACSSASPGPSHVLEAIGVSAADAAGAVRLSVGRMTEGADIDQAIECFAAINR